jgi:PAS domain S-box-containing protein
MIDQEAEDGAIWRISRELRESEARLRLAIDAGRMAIWELDLASGTLLASPELNRILGFPPETVPDLAMIRAHYAPGERARLDALAQEVLARGDRHVEAQLRFIRPDGSLRWLMLRTEIVRDDTNRALRQIGVLSDITQRKSVELALDEARALAEAKAVERDAILGQLAEGVVITDPGGRIVFVNEAASRIHGVARLDVTPDAYSETYHLLTEDGQPYPSQELPLARAVLHGETVSDVRWRIRRPDGTEVIAIGSARPVLSADGATRLGAVLTLRDDTARAVAEAALRDLNANLGRLVAERTAELEQTHEALRQSQKMEAVGQLTGGVAHDFNNLLQIVTGNLEILQRHLPEDAERLHRCVANAMTGAQRATALTQRLLAFSRRQLLNPKPTSVNRLIGDMIEMLTRTLGETIAVETRLAPEIWSVEADGNQLESAILNLAINARDAMPASGALTIETANVHLDPAYVAQHPDAATGDHVLIRVRDNGTGMDEATRMRVFEPFFTTKDVGKGTGLGLSQVYGFVRQSGGSIAIDSAPGGGTKVNVYLPRRKGPDIVVAERPSASEPSLPQGQPHETILVLEDNDGVRAYSVEALRSLGYRVLEAHDGETALKLIGEGDAAIDLMFSDVVLPGGISGADVAAQARTQQPGLKVLFTTGYARETIVHDGRLDSGVELLTKPFTYADLAARVRDVLDQPQAERQ